MPPLAIIHAHNRLAALLREQEEQLLLQEGPLNAAQMKTKLGIKATAISDDDMQRLMEVTQDKKQLVALVRFALETKDLQQVISYGSKMVEVDPKLDPQRFATFTKFTEYVDSKVPPEAVTSGGGFNLDSQPADWASQDGRYRVYKAQGRPDCIKYGHGQSFCISRTTSGNLYHHYRSVQQSQFYFVFDTALPETDNKYITVVDVQPGGKTEFTHKSNDTPGTSQDYGYKLANFLRTKPGLEACPVFTPTPTTPQEKEEKRRWFEVAATGTFAQLSREDKLMFISNGENPIHGDQLKGMDPKLQNEFVSIFGSRLYETDLQYFVPGQQVRIVADLLEEGVAEFSEPMLAVIMSNLGRFYLRLAFRQEPAPQGMSLIKWNSVQLLLQALPDPTPVLQRYPAEVWKESFESTLGKNGGHLSRFCLQARNLSAIETYVGSPIFRQGMELAQPDQISNMLCRPGRTQADVDRLTPGQAQTFLNQKPHIKDIMRRSALAFPFMKKLAELVEWDMAELYKYTCPSGRAEDDACLLNVIMTSPDPLAVHKAIPFVHDENVIAGMHPQDICRFVKQVRDNPKAIPFAQELMRNGCFPEEVFTADWWGRLSPEEETMLDAAHLVYNQWKPQQGAALNERYLNRFKKILNS